MQGTQWPPDSRFTEVFEELKAENASKMLETQNNEELEKVEKQLGHNLSAQERVALEIAERQHKAEQDEKEDILENIEKGEIQRR